MSSDVQSLEACLLPSVPEVKPSQSRNLNVVVASSLLPPFAAPPNDIENSDLQLTIDRVVNLDNVCVYDASCAPSTVRWNGPLKERGEENVWERWAAKICQWADLLILFPWDADSMASMLHGNVHNHRWLLLLRMWDVTKKILLVPGMNTLMWENPITKKQLSKLKRKWNWVRVIPHPMLWDARECEILPWDGQEELVETIKAARDLLTIGHDVNIIPSSPSFEPPKKTGQLTVLPPELWSMVLDYTRDWELATALNVHTTLPVPLDWLQATSDAGPQTFMQKLEWSILCGRLSETKQLLQSNPQQRWLSVLCVKLIMRFCKINLLCYLEMNHKELFREVFGSTFLPDKASSAFGKIALLDFWYNSPSFLTKEYTTEAVDGASRAGFIHVLEWWRQSGLPVKYSESAMEQASSKSQVEVLEWWKNATSLDSKLHPQSQSVLKLKPGKSISYATQSGSLLVLRWWANSGIPFPHEDTIAKLASTHGHVHLLTFWAQLRGEKMLYDHQVLVGATKMGHSEVLEWWKRSGLRVEYKICDIEEALEDGVEGLKGDGVRRWWAKSGLNLGVGTSEWMRTKVLGRLE